MNSTLTAAPAVRPLTASEFQRWARIDADLSDVGLTIALDAAIDEVERWIGARCITQTWTDTWHDFLTTRLAWNPVQSITSVAYIDNAGDSQTLSTDVYELRTDIYGAYVGLKYGQQWPTDLRCPPTGVTVVYVAGFGDTGADVPGAIRNAIASLAAHKYEYREGDILPPEAVWNALQPMRFYPHAEHA